MSWVLFAAVTGVAGLWLAASAFPARFAVAGIAAALAVGFPLFGSVVATGIAFAAVGCACGWAAGLHRLIPGGADADLLIMPMTAALTVTQVFFAVRRFRAERAKGRRDDIAVTVTMTTVGRAVTAAGFAVIVPALVLAPVVRGRLSTVVAATLLGGAGSLAAFRIVLPVLLSTFGAWTDRGRVPVLWRLSIGQAPARVWTALARVTSARPGWALTATAVLLTALAVAAVTAGLTPETVLIAAALIAPISANQFCLLFDRIRAEKLAGMTQANAVASATRGTAGVLTGSALAAGGLFAAAGLAGLGEPGAVAAVAVVADALAVRIFGVPALLAMWSARGQGRVSLAGHAARGDHGGDGGV